MIKYNKSQNYHISFRKYMVELVENGANKNELIKQYGFSKTSLKNWIKKYKSL